MSLSVLSPAHRAPLARPTLRAVRRWDLLIGASGRPGHRGNGSSRAPCRQMHDARASAAHHILPANGATTMSTPKTSPIDQSRWQTALPSMLEILRGIARVLPRLRRPTFRSLGLQSHGLCHACGTVTKFDVREVFWPALVTEWRLTPTMKAAFDRRVVSRLLWKREKAHSSGEMYTTHGPSCRTASGGMRHGQGYQQAASRE